MSIIEMRDVVKKYDNGTTALRGVTVSIDAGEFAYIVGPSGAGKSTFIRSLYREVKIDKGSLQVAGFNLVKIKKKDIPLLRRNVGVVFQDYKLLPKKTVYENIAYAMEVVGESRRNIKKRVMEVLGGGGHSNVAGAQLKGLTIEEAQEAVRKALEEIPEEKESE